MGKFLSLSFLTVPALMLVGLLTPMVSRADIDQKPVIYVNNKIGSDKSDGQTPEKRGKSGPVASIMQAVRIAPVGACISIANTGIDYRETIKIEAFRKGRAASPLVLDGHGATVNGLVEVPTESWKHVKDDIYAFDGLMPDGKRMTMPNSNWLSHLRHQGWFVEPEAPEIFLLNGKSALHTDDLAKIVPGGFFYDTQASQRCIYFRLPANAKLADQHVELPLNEGVYISDDYVVVRNLRSVYSQDDGFYGFWGIGQVFENVYAGYNCDQGFSMHGTASTVVDGALFEYNAGCGIADVMSCVTIYRNTVVRNNLFCGALLQGHAFALLNCRFENNRGAQVKGEYLASLNLVNCLINGGGENDGLEIVGGRVDHCTIVNCTTGFRGIKGATSVTNSIISNCTNPIELKDAAIKETGFSKTIVALNGNEPWEAYIKRTFGANADNYLQNKTAFIADKPALKAPVFRLPADSPYANLGDFNTPLGNTLEEYLGWKVIDGLGQPVMHP